MDLIFKKTSDDTRKIGKSFTNLTPTTAVSGKVPATATDNCSVLNPVWLLAYDSSYKDATHVECEQFGRTYYITDLVMGTGGKCYIYGQVDVLATYPNSIKACKCCVTRSESAGVNWVTDTCYPINPNKKSMANSKLFPFSGFTSSEDTYFVDIAEYKLYDFEVPELPD